MPRIPLSQGRFALVDAEDYEWISQWKWTLFGRGERTPYAYRKDQGKTVLMHRLITGALPGQVTDHINQDGLDNRRSNLRLCTPQQNAWNSRGHSRWGSKTSKYKGVHWCATQKRWVAKIGVNGRTRYGGVFQCELEAAKAYDKLAKEVRGEFAWLNFSAKR